MAIRDEVLSYVNYEHQEAELIITDSLNYSLTQLFDEAMCMIGWFGLEYINATIFYQSDEKTKLELAWIEFDDEGKYEDGFTYG